MNKNRRHYTFWRAYMRVNEVVNVNGTFVLNCVRLDSAPNWVPPVKSFKVR